MKKQADKNADLLPKVNWRRLDDTPAIFSVKGINAGFWGRDDELTSLEFQNPKQIHSTKIIPAEMLRIAKSTIEADGIYVTQKNEKIAIQTADCLPILIVSEDKKLAMAVHAGWRGLAAGILKEALQLYNSFKINSKKIHIAFGPCLGPKKFEVGPEVLDAFVQSPCQITSEQLNLCVTKGQNDRSFFDMALFAVWYSLSQKLNPKNIHVFRHCTYLEADRWYSYRREGQTGRNWAWVEIK